MLLAAEAAGGSGMARISVELEHVRVTRELLGGEDGALVVDSAARM